MKCYILFSVIFICKKELFGIFTCSKYVFDICLICTDSSMAAMDGSIRNLISIRSLIIFCLSSTKVRSNGSSIIPGVAETYEPEPWRMVITLRDASARIASRRELLPTFSRSHITVSFGSLSPGCRFSSSMYLIILSAILWERVFLWNFACDLPPVAQYLDV